MKTLEDRITEAKNRFGQEFYNVGWHPENKKKVLDFIDSEIRKAVLDERKEIAESIPFLFSTWKKDVEKSYEDGRKTRHPFIVLSFPEWLQDALFIELEQNDK